MLYCFFRLSLIGGCKTYASVVTLMPWSNKQNLLGVLWVYEMEEEEFDRAIQEGTYDDGYFPGRLIKGLKKLTDKVDFIPAAVSYGHTFDVRRRIDGVVPASDWTDRMLLMMMLSKHLSFKFIGSYIPKLLYSIP